MQNRNSVFSGSLGLRRAYVFLFAELLVYYPDNFCLSWNYALLKLCISLLETLAQRKHYEVAWYFIFVLLALVVVIYYGKKEFHNPKFTSGSAFDFIIKHCKDNVNLEKEFDVKMLPIGKERQLKNVYTPLVIEGNYQPGITKSISNIEELFDNSENGKNPKILIVGPSGIGKSVLCKKILYDWKTSVYKFYRDKLVILLKLRDFNLEEEKILTFHDMLLASLPGGHEDIIERIYEYVVAYPQKVVLVFDDLDALKIDHDIDISQIKDTSHDYNKPMPLLHLFTKIIFGQFLPGATVIATVRPTAWDNQYTMVFGDAFHRTAEILGFNEDKIRMYIINYFHGDNDKASKILDYVFGCPELTSLLRTPACCLVTCLTLDLYFSNRNCKGSDDGNEFLLKTLPELYQITDQVICWHCRPKYKDVMRKRDYFCSDRQPPGFKETLFKLMEIAHYVMLNRSFSSDEDLKKSKLDMVTQFLVVLLGEKFRSSLVERMIPIKGYVPTLL